MNFGMMLVQILYVIANIVSAVAIDTAIDDAVDSIKDGHKNMMFVMNSNHKAAMAQTMNWQDLLVLGASILAFGVVFGIGIMCCWVNRQWNHMAEQVERAAIKSARQIMREMIIMAQNQPPPSYDTAIESSATETIVRDTSTDAEIALEEMSPLNCSDMSVNITPSELGQ